jgi:ABC-2 type transport system ATP-binding protein
VNGLDPPGIIWMRDFLRGMAVEGRAVLVSSHLLGELAEVADRVVIIDRGRLVADSPLSDLVASRSSTVELRCANPRAVATYLQDLGHRARLDGDLLVVDGATAREVGFVVDLLDAGPISQLSERAARFEDVYFELAGSLAAPARDHLDQAAS